MSATEKWRYEITSSCQELFSQLSLFLDPSSAVPIIPPIMVVMTSWETCLVM